MHSRADHGVRRLFIEVLVLWFGVSESGKDFLNSLGALADWRFIADWSLPVSGG
jgi:hypothetical protein